MKKKYVVTFLCAFSMVLFISGTCLASLYSDPIVLVEADPNSTDDSDTTVTFKILDPINSGWTIGYYDGSYNPFSLNTDITMEAGTVIDFYIEKGTTRIKLSDIDNTYVNFYNLIDSSLNALEKPLWVSEWYNDFYINWDVGTGI